MNEGSSVRIYVGQGYPKEGTACANILRRDMIECLRNNKEASEQRSQGGRGC